MNSAADPREAMRTAWTQSMLQNGCDALIRASVDAGFRSYWRTHAHGKTFIVMDSPADKENVRPWLRIRELLQSGGVRVPNVFAEDIENGFLLLEDLGADTYLNAIQSGNADADRLFDAAITQLLQLQSIAPPNDLPHYDEALLARELHLFNEWYVGRHLGITLDRSDLQALDKIYRILIGAALAQPQVLVHRDFMPRNLMPVDDGPAVLDFQDAVVGPIAYDVMSLFKDAFLSWPKANVSQWLAQYHARAIDAGLPAPPIERFLRDADWIGVQRHLKVIGIFARLHHRDNKPKYLADVPRFFDYLADVLPKYSELAPLHHLIDTKIKPAIAQRAQIVAE